MAELLSIMATTPDPGMLSQWYDSYTQKNQTAQAPATGTTATSQTTAAPTAAVTQWTPGQANTVQGQLGKVLDAGGPLMDRAATKAQQAMNQRGLLNSTMAITAGQSALYDAALPIAQQDASTFATAGKTNVDAMNAAGAQTAGFQQQANLQAADIGNQQAMQSKDLASRYDLAGMDVASRERLQAADIANQQKLQAANAQLQAGMQAADLSVRQSMQQYDGALRTALQGADNESKLQLQTLDAEARTQLANIEAKYRTGMQQSDSMARSYQSMVDSVTRIMLDPNLDAGAKQAAINSTTTLYNNALQIQSDVSGLKLGGLLAVGELNPGATTPPPVTTPERPWRNETIGSEG